ncbi:MAG TPA: tetratricopeptide repeat protein [Gaiellaceae bacterium]|nr:tetratricopeptide repeat protein [Gaiellaceae bacterium]
MDQGAARALLALAEEVAPGLKGLDREAAFARLGERYEELIAALDWFVGEQRADESISLARWLGPFWQATRRLDEATDRFDRALALPGGDDDLRGRGMVEAGLLWFWRGDDERATALFEQALELSRGLEAPTVGALALTGLARIALRDDDLAESRRLCVEALELSESGADPIGRGGAAHVLGVTAQMLGDLNEARRWMSERVDLARADGNYGGLGMEANNLAMVERQLGNFDRADELSREALDIFHRRRDEWAYPFGLSGLAAVAVERGDLGRAATLIGAADARVQEQGASWPPDERPHYEAVVAALETSMDAAELKRARAAGCGLTPDEAVAYALSGAA